MCYSVKNYEICIQMEIIAKKHVYIYQNCEIFIQILQMIPFFSAILITKIKSFHNIRFKKSSNFKWR